MILFYPITSIFVLPHKYSKNMYNFLKSNLSSLKFQTPESEYFYSAHLLACYSLVLKKTIPQISNIYQLSQIYLPFDLLSQVDLEAPESLWNPVRRKGYMLIGSSEYTFFTKGV